MYQKELESNASVGSIKQDPQEVNKLKEALGEIDKAVDPTVGAGMNIDDLMTKLLDQNKQDNPDVVYETFDETGEKND